MPISPLSLRAADLKLRFGVYGDFYQIFWGGKPYACRSVLELIDHTHTPTDPNAIHGMNPDLLVVMMNPGSSKPLQPGYTPRNLQEGETQSGTQRVKTRPDNTQYQIMRVMVAGGFKHARILNLSDLREPKSAVLMPMIQALCSLPNGAQHSLFCDDRDQERERLMGPWAAVPVLAGWGRQQQLLPLAEQCLKKLRGWRLIGVRIEEKQPFYAHPSPMLQTKKEAWLATVLGQLPNRATQ